MLAVLPGNPLLSVEFEGLAWRVIEEHKDSAIATVAPIEDHAILLAHEAFDWQVFQQNTFKKISDAWKADCVDVFCDVAGDDVAMVKIGGFMEDIALDGLDVFLPAAILVHLHTAFDTVKEAADAKLLELSSRHAASAKRLWMRENTRLVMSAIADVVPGSANSILVDWLIAGDPDLPEWYHLQTRRSMSSIGLVSELHVRLREAGYTVQIPDPSMILRFNVCWGPVKEVEDDMEFDLFD